MIRRDEIDNANIGIAIMEMELEYEQYKFHTMSMEHSMLNEGYDVEAIDEAIFASQTELSKGVTPDKIKLGIQKELEKIKDEYDKDDAIEELEFLLSELIKNRNVPIDTKLYKIVKNLTAVLSWVSIAAFYFSMLSFGPTLVIGGSFMYLPLFVSKALTTIISVLGTYGGLAVTTVMSLMTPLFKFNKTNTKSSRVVYKDMVIYVKAMIKYLKSNKKNVKFVMPKQA